MNDMSILVIAFPYSLSHVFFNKQFARCFSLLKRRMKGKRKHFIYKLYCLEPFSFFFFLQISASLVWVFSYYCCKKKILLILTLISSNILIVFLSSSPLSLTISLSLSLRLKSNKLAGVLKYRHSRHWFPSALGNTCGKMCQF